MTTTQTSGTSAQPTPQRVYRFSLYVKKRADISEEEFGRHWRESHAPLVGEWLKQYGILKYVQVSLSSLRIASGMPSLASNLEPRVFIQLLPSGICAEDLLVSYAKVTLAADKGEVAGSRAG
jgi:hypothetical protein